MQNLQDTSCCHESPTVRLLNPGCISVQVRYRIQVCSCDTKECCKPSMNSTKCVIFSNEVVKPLGTFYIHPTTEYCLVKLRRSTMLYGGLPQYGLSVLSYAHAGTVPICPDNCLHQRHLECHPDPSIPRAHSLAVTGIPPTCSLYSSGISTTAGHFRVGVCVVDPPVLAMLSNNLPLPGELGCELSGYLAS